MKFTLILTFLFGAGFSNGQTIDGRQVARAELLTDASDFSKPFTVGVRFVLESDWYLYWKNPGDSGLPIEVEWDLPDGWAASELRHPVPSKFAHDNVVSYGYKNEVILLTTITPGNQPLEVLNAKLDWLICRESCIRGKADVALPLNAGAATPEARSAINTAQEKFPHSADQFRISIGQGEIKEAESGWEADITLEGSAAASITDFYPEATDDVLIEYGSIRVNDGKLQFRFEKQNSAGDIVNVRGLFIAGTKGFEGTIPLHFKSM